jgi:hypothetical protein
MGGDDSYAQDDEEEDENIEVSMGDFLGEEWRVKSEVVIL